MKPRVFVVQQPAKMDANRRWRPLFDISPAKRFGEIQYLLLRPGNIYADAWDVVLNRMRDVLKDYSDADYLLPTGEPSAIVAAAIIAGAANEGRVKLLKWNRIKTDYEVVQLRTRG